MNVIYFSGKLHFVGKLLEVKYQKLKSLSNVFLLFNRYLTDRTILNGISFDVPAGKSVAIVGTSGSGNSS